MTKETQLINKIQLHTLPVEKCKGWTINEHNQAETEFNRWFHRQTSNERTMWTAVWDIQGSNEHLLVHDSKKLVHDATNLLLRARVSC